MAYVIGIDASTTATKAVVIDESVRVPDMGVAEYAYADARERYRELYPALASTFHRL